nr:PKD domain-containing protein [Raineya sp.]
MKNLYKYLLVVLLYACPWFVQGQVKLTVNLPSNNNSTCNRGANNFLLGDIVIQETAKGDISFNATARSITLKLPEGFKFNTTTTGPPTIALSSVSPTPTNTDLETPSVSINAAPDRDELTISFKTKTNVLPSISEDHIDVITISNIRVDIDIVASGDHDYEIITLTNFTGVNPSTILGLGQFHDFISFPVHILGGGQCAPCGNGCSNPPFCDQDCPTPCNCSTMPLDPCCFRTATNTIINYFKNSLNTTKNKLDNISKPLWGLITPNTSVTERISGNALPTVVGVCPSDVCININTNYNLSGTFNGAFRYRAGHKAVTLKAVVSGTNVSVSNKFVVGSPIPGENTVHYDYSNYLGVYTGPQQTEAWQDGDYIQINLAGSGCGALELIRVSIPTPSAADLDAIDSANPGVPIPVNLSDNESSAQEIQLGNFGNTTFEYTQISPAGVISPANYDMYIDFGGNFLIGNPYFKVESGKWTFNPSGLSLDFPYLVRLVDRRATTCGQLKFFKIRLFDNSPKQLIGITNGGVCNNITQDVPIGWIGQGQIGYLSCIEEIGSTGFIIDNLRPEYVGERGTNSGFKISHTKIAANNALANNDPAKRTFIEVRISFYVCDFAPTSAQLAGCPTSAITTPNCIRKTVLERITIADIPTPTITFLDGTLLPATNKICANSPSITLVGTPTGGFGASKSFKVYPKNTTPPTASKPSLVLNFNPSLPEPLLAGTTYTIEYKYKSEYGCESTVFSEIEVIALPTAVPSQVFKFCTGTTALPRLTLSGLPPNTNVRWYSASDVPLGIVNNDSGYEANLPFDIERDYFFKVRVINSDNCESAPTDINVVVAKPPVVNFSATESCQALGGTIINFINNSSLTAPGQAFVESSEWDFGDGSPFQTIAGISNTNHNYANPGIYTVRLTIKTDANVACETFLEKKIIVHKNAQLVAGIYSEDFEANDTTQITCGVSKKSSWTFIPITRADGTTGKAFATNNSSNKYNDSEYSWIESPCFDLSSLNAPLINIKMRYNTDSKADGAFVMYTTNNGLNWKILGDLNQGSEWYNSKDILGMSAISDNIERKGWSGKSEDFIDAKLSLASVKQEISSSPTTPVRFRIVFASNSDNPANVDFTGVAIDRVVILDKNHKVLLEHFTNTTSPSLQDPTWTSFVNNPSPKTDLVYVQYHTSYPTGDVLSQVSRPESNARSLHYAVSQPPYTVVDGRMEAGKL